MAVDAEVDDRGGEATLIEAEIVGVAHGGSRHAGGGREQRNDDAARRIAADALPGLDVEAEHQRQAEHRDRDREIVGEPPARHLARAWRRDHALRPGYRDRQSAVGPELPWGAKADPAGRAP